MKNKGSTSNIVDLTQDDGPQSTFVLDHCAPPRPALAKSTTNRIGREKRAKNEPSSTSKPRSPDLMPNQGNTPTLVDLTQDDEPESTFIPSVKRAKIEPSSTPNVVHLTQDGEPGTFIPTSRAPRDQLLQTSPPTVGRDWCPIPG